ncbi:MAG: hypothetical protein ABF313_05870, partial [Marivita sp.]
SDEAPEDLPDPLIDDFTDATAPTETTVEPEIINFPTVAATAVEGETLALEQAEALEFEDSDDSDAAGMADLMMFLPFLGILAMFM